MTNQVGVRTNCAKRKERIKERWETAKWLTIPGKNVLVVVYRTPDAPAEHKKTAHHHTWRDTVAEMTAEPHTLPTGGDK